MLARQFLRWALQKLVACSTRCISKGSYRHSKYFAQAVRRSEQARLPCLQLNGKFYVSYASLQWSCKIRMQQFRRCTCWKQERVLTAVTVQQIKASTQRRSDRPIAKDCEPWYSHHCDSGVAPTTLSPAVFYNLTGDSAVAVAIVCCSLMTMHIC